MTLTVKILVVLLCFALCAAGTFIAASARDQSHSLQKTNTIRVKNRELAPRVWILS
jgi:hypothetical protein